MFKCAQREDLVGYEMNAFGLAKPETRFEDRLWVASSYGIVWIGQN